MSGSNKRARDPSGNDALPTYELPEVPAHVRAYFREQGQDEEGDMRRKTRGSKHGTVNPTLHDHSDHLPHTPLVY